MRVLHAALHEAAGVSDMGYGVLMSVLAFICGTFLGIAVGAAGYWS